MCQKGAILLDSVDLAQAQNCQVDLTHAQRIEKLPWLLRRQSKRVFFRENEIYVFLRERQYVSYFSVSSG